MFFKFSQSSPHFSLRNLQLFCNFLSVNSLQSIHLILFPSIYVLQHFFICIWGHVWHLFSYPVYNVRLFFFTERNFLFSPKVHDISFFHDLSFLPPLRSPAALPCVYIGCLSISPWSLDSRLYSTISFFFHTNLLMQYTFPSRKSIP